MQEGFDKVFHANFQVTLVVVIVIVISQVKHPRREDPGRHIARACNFVMSKPNIGNKLSHHTIEGE